VHAALSDPARLQTTDTLLAGDASPSELAAIYQSWDQRIAATAAAVANTAATARQYQRPARTCRRLPLPADHSYARLGTASRPPRAGGGPGAARPWRPGSH